MKFFNLMASKDLTGYKFISELQALSFIEEIWLFGSRARGDNSNRSDIDIAIICPTATSLQWLQVVRIIENSDTLLKIDCVRFDKSFISEDLYHNILRDKIIIYKKFMQQNNYNSFDSLNNAISRFKELLEHKDIDNIDYMRDASIQRFEFVIELFWKVLKKILSYEKIESTTPRDVINKAFQYKLINDEEAWLSMLDDRNNTSHAYNEDSAKLIFIRIKQYLPIFEASYNNLQQYKALL
ncbi:MAG: HI0074 family nucleotidyltransferase substrate-binding subunit [Rickettsiales bacterium]|nr:HI0074 family nucleotidyltransferase substrate-binding subunit [Rickettsiales bacterium]